MIDKTNFNSSSFEYFDINLVQKEVDGGIVQKEQIDSIKEYPEAKSIIISGLKQDTFSYFIQKYGNQFETISFWKNKMVSDLSELGTLRNIKYINYFFNQKATTLWNMKENKNLIGLGIYDFSKLHSIDKIQTAENLEVFRLGNMVWSKMEIDSFKSLVNTNIKHFEWCGGKVSDNDYKCLSRSKIEILDINPTQFTMDELTDILSLFPESLSGTITKPYRTMGIKDNNGYTEYHYLCKHKKTCVAGKDDDRFLRYLQEYDVMLSQKRKNAIL